MRLTFDRPAAGATGWVAVTLEDAGARRPGGAPPGRRVPYEGEADVATVAARLVRPWLGLDMDVAAARLALADDPLLGQLLARRPGLAVPGTVDGGELALRTVLGQQVSVAAARTLTGRLVELLGAEGEGGLRSFPAPAVIADAGIDRLRSIGLTGSRAATVVHLAAALAGGLDLGPHAERSVARLALRALPGIGPWTVEYVALRSLRDADAFPAHDLVLRQALGGADAREAVRMAEPWRPWRGLAAQHLWRAAALGEPIGPSR